MAARVLIGRRFAAFAAAGILAAVLISCGSSGGASGTGEFQKITPSDRVFTLDDFTAARFKKSKQYDVEGLSEALSAWKGFWGPGGSNRKDYELRFYGSHESAVRAGAPIADEGTGELFRQTKDSQTWTAGQKDRWRSGNVTAGSTGGVTAAPGPIYADFAIFGNVVLLCEGANTEQSFERCEGLINAVRQATGA